MNSLVSLVNPYFRNRDGMYRRILKPSRKTPTVRTPKLIIFSNPIRRGQGFSPKFKLALRANEPFGHGSTIETLYRRHDYRVYAILSNRHPAALKRFETGVLDEYGKSHIRLTYEDMVWILMRY